MPPRVSLRLLRFAGANPTLTSLCEKSLRSAIGRRNRLPHHSKSSSYRTVGHAVSPVERRFTQTRQLGVIVVPCANPKLTRGAERNANLALGYGAVVHHQDLRFFENILRLEDGGEPEGGSFFL